jgi:lipoyl(octanoyl) transferase
MVVSLVNLGRLDYAKALALQEQVCALRKQERIGDVLLLVEHPPVLTLGRNAHRQHVVASDELLAQRSISLFATNRGGDVTYHGPGQLVGYPILDLRGFAPPLGVVNYLRKLEEVPIRACADYGVLTERISGRAGVWTMPSGSIAEKKIAALGVHVSRGVTSHGFALNVTTDLHDFDLIVPCGIRDRGVASMETEVDTQMHPAPTLDQMANSVARHFGRVFGRRVVWVEEFEDLIPEALPDRNTAVTV